jgi:hypothetical protein
MSWNRLVEHLRAFGYSIRQLEYTRWLELLRQSRVENALVHLLSFFERMSEERLGVPPFDSRNAREALSDAAVTTPTAEALLDVYLSFFVRTGFLPPPERASSV